MKILHYEDMEAKVFYMDIRSFGKGFEELYRRSKEARVQYIRGIPGDIVEDPKTKNLMLTVEDTTTGRIEDHELEMVVLSVGVTPRVDSDHIQRLLTLSRTADGFFMESHPKLKPVDAPTVESFWQGVPNRRRISRIQSLRRAERRQGQKLYSPPAR